jgi:hypothetical protein
MRAVTSCLLIVTSFVGAGLAVVIDLAARFPPVSGYGFAVYGVAAALAVGVGLLIGGPVGLVVAFSINANAPP